MRKSVRTLAVAIVAVTVCGGCGGMSSPASTTTAPNASTSDPSPITPGDADGTGPTTMSAGTPTSSSLEVQLFLTIARRAFPQRNDVELVDEAGTICARLSKNASIHDAVGDLAAQLGNQAQAQQLVEAATAAYCPSVG